MNPILKEISAIESNPEDVYVIHSSQYSNEKKNYYPKRVSFIYLQNLNGSESIKYSIEGFAIKNNIDNATIEDWYDELETWVLSEFNTFLRARANCTFIYWFEEGQELILDMIKGRYEELKLDDDDNPFNTISASNRKTIQHLVRKVVPRDGCKDLKQFVKYHNHDQIVHGFLNNAEESICFERKDFNKIEMSVISKVGFFVALINSCCEMDFAEKKSSNNDPVDIQAFPPLTLFRRMTIKSWLALFSLLAGSLGIGVWVSSFEIKTLKEQNSDLQIELLKQKQLFEDSISHYHPGSLKK